MAGSRRSVPLPIGWRALCNVVLARDPSCRYGILENEPNVVCLQPSTEVDHIGAAWDHRPEVLRGICHNHHIIRTSAQANAAKALLRSLRYRPKEKHPGYRLGTAEVLHIWCHI